MIVSGATTRALTETSGVGHQSTRWQPPIERIRRIAFDGRLDESIRETRILRVRARLAGDRRLAAELSFDLAWYGFQSALGPKAVAAADMSATLFRTIGDKASEARALSLRAWCLLEIGRSQEAAEQAFDALRLAEATADRRSLSWSANVIGVIYWYCGQPRHALDRFGRALSLAHELDDPLLVGLWLINLGGAHAQIGEEARLRSASADAARETATGIRLTEEALVLLERSGDRWSRVLAVLNLVGYELRQGAGGRAAALLDRAAAIGEVASDRIRIHRLELQGAVLLDRGHVTEAIDSFREGLARAERKGNVVSIVEFLNGLADAHERQGDFRQALTALRRKETASALLVAERVQQRARLQEMLLGIRRLENEVAIAAIEKADIARSCETLQRRVRDLSADRLSDALTGIGNRRRLDEALASLPSKEAFAIAMIDIDHFKSINDRFSHVVGDEVLRAVARVLASDVRTHDVVVRYGGEEFAILIPGAPLARAVAACRRLRRAISAVAAIPGMPECRITASFGIASSAEAASPSDVLALADRRLYRAKRTGRNRVVSRGEAPRPASPPAHPFVIDPAARRPDRRRSRGKSVAVAEDPAVVSFNAP